MEFRTAADIDKSSAKAHWGLARAYENLGQFYESIDELNQVADLDANNLEAKTKLGNYFLLTNPPQISETSKILDDIFARNPNFIEGYILKASLLKAQGKPEREILDVLNQAVALDPTRTETYLSLARFFIKIGKPNDAEQAINKGISINPTSASGYLEYGRFLDYADRAPEAEMQFKKAVEVEPKNLEAGQSLAEFYLNEKQFDRAEQVYKNLIESQANSPESRMDLANFYAQTNRADDAVKIYGEIVQEQPEYVRARYRLGEIYLERRETAKVGEQIEQLLKINDDDEEALMLRARASLQTNKTDEAIADLDEILKKKPSQKNALFFMAQARLALGQIDQARTLITERGRQNDGIRALNSQARLIDDFGEKETQDAVRGATQIEDTPAYAQLIQKRAELSSKLENLKLTLREKHPEVIKAQNDIDKVNDEIEKLKQNTQARVKSATVSSSRKADLQKQNLEIEKQKAESQIGQIDQQMQFKDEEIKQNAAQIAVLEGKINTIPNVKVALESINNQYTSAKTTYDDLLKKKNDASLQVDRESNAQGETIRVQDAANLPSSPVAPKRAMLTAFGAALGLVIGLFLAVVFEFPRLLKIQNIEDAKHYTGLPVLASVPVLMSHKEKVWRSRIHWFKVLAGVAAAVGFIPLIIIALEKTRVFERVIS